MMTPYKPESYNSISPYLIVDGANATIAFLVRTFDAVELRRHDGEDGSIMHAEVRIDDSVVMLSDGSPNFPAVASHVHLYVPDVDATYRRALAAGGESIQEPMQGGDADKRGGVRDAGGTTWWIATQQS